MAALIGYSTAQGSQGSIAQPANHAGTTLNVLVSFFNTNGIGSIDYSDWIYVAGYTSSFGYTFRVHYRFGEDIPAFSFAGAPTTDAQYYLLCFKDVAADPMTNSTGSNASGTTVANSGTLAIGANDYAIGVHVQAQTSGSPTLIGELINFTSAGTTEVTTGTLDGTMRSMLTVGDPSGASSAANARTRLSGFGAQAWKYALLVNVLDGTYVPPTGPSFNRDGVEGANIASVSGVQAADIGAVDGVSAVSEGGILLSNDPRYMRKAA